MNSCKEYFIRANYLVNILQLSQKIKIYVDENLDIERHMIDHFRDKSDSTLGKELCEY